MIEIQVLTPDDWKAWRALRLAALAEAPYAFGSTLAQWQGEGDREERWRDRLASPGSYNLIASIDGEPVGMGSGAPSEDEGTVELLSMWVAPAGRGKGVGDRLIEEIESWALAQGASRFALAVTDGNRAATGLYLRHGFRDIGVPGDLMSDGVRHEVLMDKKLPG